MARTDRISDRGIRIFTTVEVARRCGVTQRAVIYWIEQGKLEAYRTPGGHRRVEEPDLLAFMEQHGIGTRGNGTKARGVRILVVDDDPEFVAMIRGVIEEEDDRYQVDSASSGFEAGCLVAEWQPDLVLLDVLMPDMDGIEVCKRIKRDPVQRRIRIVAVSAVLDPKAKEQILAAGAEEFLHKPFPADALMAVLGRYAPL